MPTNLIRRSAVTLGVALLAACGGGADTPSSPASSLATPAPAVATATTPTARAAAAAEQLAERAGIRRQALAAASTAADSVTVFDPEEAARQLMVYAETHLPAYFPGPAATQALPPFLFRHYPATGIYLGVVVDEAEGYSRHGVYVMGGAFGNAPLHVGQVADFVTPVAAGFRATPAAGGKALVTQGSHTTLRVDLQRLGGFAGAVQLSLAGLPQGVTATPVTVQPGASFAEIPLAASTAAPHSLPTTVTLSASASFGPRSGLGRHSVTVTVRGTPGAVDTTFGGGAVITPVANSEDYAHAVAVQADGKIVVAGWTDQTGTDANFLVLRYLANGTLDAGFANGGSFVLPIGLGNGTDRAHAIAIQDDGKIVVGGTTLTSTSTSGQDFALIRLTTSGALDEGFGQGGKVVTPMSSHSGSDVVYALALPVIGGEQRILAVGGEGDFIAARYTRSGALDGSFGSGGKVVGLFGRNIGTARAVALLPGGRMLLAGGIYNDFAAAQLTENGQLDPSFGQAGRVTVPVSATNWDNATAVVRLDSGKLLLGGWAYSGHSSSGDFVAVRLLPGGALDTFFGNEGIAVHPVAAGTRSDSARGLVLQSDDRIPTVRAILGGEVSVSNYDFGLLRLWL